MSEQVAEELELGDYLAILKRRWAWVLVPLIALPAVAFYLSTTQADTFTASSEVLLSDSAAQSAVDAGSQNTSFRARILENEISLALSDQASAVIADRFDRDVDDIPGFTVTADASSDVLVFSTSRPTADGAATVANVAAETYVSLKQEQAAASITGAVSNLETTLMELQVEREEARSTLIGLEDALTRASEDARPAAQARVDREESRISGQIALIDAQIGATADSVTQLELSGELALGGTARIVSVANPPINSSNAPASRNLVLGLVVGAILGAALALLRENLDNKIRTTDDLERLGLVPLGSVPKASNKTAQSLELALISLRDPDTAQGQSHQKIEAAVRFLAGQHDISNLLVTSASQGEGKTTLASNLAISMARSNTRTVLVDLDLRRPRVHKAYDLPQSPGITSVVVEELDVADAATLIGFGFAVGSSSWLGLVAALLAVFTAYVRAMGKVAGAHQEFCGPMAKPQRMFVITLAALFVGFGGEQLLPKGNVLGPFSIPVWTLWLIVAGCVVTVFRRLARIAEALRKD